MSSSSSSTLSITQLRSDFAGQVIAPDDDGYDSARRLFMGGIDLHPAVIIRPHNAQEVARVIGVAEATGLELAVRCGGHSGNAHSGVDGGIVLDLANMKALDLDVDSRTAWAEAGLTAGEYTQAATEHGLATGFGDTGSVGIGGITLGGGVGFLSRKYGLTIDNLLAAEIVTADGTVLTVDAENHPDLFWAIRGGGGNFGVVTRFRYQLREVPRIVGGMLMLPATADIIEGAVAASFAAPDELSGILNVMSAPPMPFIPEHLHGQIVIMALLCYAGSAEAGEEALAPFRALATPLADMLQPMPYTGMFQGGPGGDDYHPTAVSQTHFHNKIDRADAETIIRHLENSDAPMRAAQLRVLGGAVSRVPDDATAYAHRDAPIMTNLASFYIGPDDKPQREAWLKAFGADLDQGRSGRYVNFVEGDGPDSIKAAYPSGTYEQLAAVKAKYDPENLFRRNINITPAG